MSELEKNSKKSDLKKQKINIQMPHMYKKPLARNQNLVQTKN